MESKASSVLNVFVTLWSVSEIFCVRVYNTWND
jgi:hypothetical protein